MIKIEIEVKCPYCDSNDIVRNGKNEHNKQRYLWHPSPPTRHLKKE